jgi:hypothetical protein
VEVAKDAEKERLIPGMGRSSFLQEALSGGLPACGITNFGKKIDNHQCNAYIIT